MTAKHRAEAALFGITFIWGGTFVVSKIGLDSISPLLLVAIRFSVASLFFFAVFGRKALPVARSSWWKGAFLGLLLFLGFAAQTVGLQYTTASKSAFITGMMVIFVPILQIIIEKRAPKNGNIIGIGIVGVGLWFLTSPAGSAFNFGDGLTLICAILFGGYIVYLDVISNDMTPLQLTFVQTTATGVLGIIAVSFFEEITFVHSSGLWLTLLYLTFLATIVTTYIQTRFQKDTTPTKAAIIFTIEPVFAAVIGFVVLSENLGLIGVIGGALIVAGIIVSEVSDSNPWLSKSFGIKA